jgi:hypothetical protein
MRLIVAVASMLAASGIEASGRLVELRNELQACTRVSAERTRVEENLLLLPIHLGVVKSLAACGCKSGGIRYRAYEAYNGRRRQMNDGVLNSIPRAGRTTDLLVVLNPDVAVHREPPYSVQMSCDQ